MSEWRAGLIFHYPTDGTLHVISQVIDDYVHDDDGNRFHEDKIEVPTKKQLNRWMNKLNDEMTVINYRKWAIKEHLQYY